MQNNLTSDSISFFSLQDCISDITKLLYNRRNVIKIGVSREFYNKIEESYDLIRFDNGGPERFYGVPLEINDWQSSPYKIFYSDGEVENANK